MNATVKEITVQVQHGLKFSFVCGGGEVMYVCVCVQKHTHSYVLGLSFPQLRNALFMSMRNSEEEHLHLNEPVSSPWKSKCLQC